MKNVNVERNVEGTSSVLAQDIKPLEEKTTTKRGEIGVIGAGDGCSVWRPIWGQIVLVER